MTITPQKVIEQYFAGSITANEACFKLLGMMTPENVGDVLAIAPQDIRFEIIRYGGVEHPERLVHLRIGDYYGNFETEMKREREEFCRGVNVVKDYLR